MNTKMMLALAGAAIAAFGLARVAADAQANDAPTLHDAAPAGPSVARGRYLAKIAGCNDCHTPAYAMRGGDVPEAGWLIGDTLGWQGPWGTTYPANLRLSFAGWTEDEWLDIAKNSQFRPPMPWFALRDMDEDDLRSLYRFVRELGPTGEPAPAYVPPGVTAPGPVVAFPSPPPQP